MTVDMQNNSNYKTVEKRSSKLFPPIQNKLNDYEQQYLRRVATCWMSTRRRGSTNVTNSQLHSARIDLPTQSLALFGVAAPSASLTFLPTIKRA